MTINRGQSEDGVYLPIVLTGGGGKPAILIQVRILEKLKVKDEKGVRDGLIYAQGGRLTRESLVR